MKKNMLRYKTETRPGLVALYDIRPGNGAGPFLQPRSPHGAWWARSLTNSRLRNDLYCVQWDVKPYYTIPYPHYQLEFKYYNRHVVFEF